VSGGRNATASIYSAALAHPGGNITGVTVYVGAEIWGKRLQILKEAVPAASKAAYLTTRVSQAAEGQQLREAGDRLQISVIELPLEEVTSTAIQRAFAEIAQQQSDALILNSNSLLFPYRQFIVELVEQNRLPALYPWREYVEAGGLMAYTSDNRELWRRMADDVQQILKGAKPGDIPIYKPTRFALVRLIHGEPIVVKGDSPPSQPNFVRPAMTGMGQIQSNMDRNAIGSSAPKAALRHRIRAAKFDRYQTLGATNPPLGPSTCWMVGLYLRCCEPQSPTLLATFRRKNTGPNCLI
jgi:hypothetical protein